MARRKSIKSRIKNSLKGLGVYGWNKPGMAFFLIVGVAAICLQTYLAQKLDSVWNWILVASTAVWTIYAMFGETRSTRKTRVSGNHWTTDRNKSRKTAFVIGAVLLLLTGITAITDILILNDVTSVDSVHATLGTIGSWLGKAAIRCALVVAAFAITLWVIYKFFDMMMEEEANNPTSCYDCIIIMFATGIESYYLGNNIADHLFSMI